MGAGGCPVVIAQWQSTGCTSQVSWVRFPAAAGLFTFLYFRLITSKLLFNRQHVCHSEGLRKFMVTCIDNISIRIKLRSVRLLCTFSSQKMLVKRKAVSYPPNIDLHKSLGSRLIIYIIVHADTSKKTSITWLWRCEWYRSSNTDLLP